MQELKNIKVTYILFYFLFLIVVLVAMFFEEHILVYVKPLIPISLSCMYIANSSSIRWLYILSMLVILVNDTFIYIDFAKYFDVIAVMIITFYVLNILLLRKYIVLKDLKIKRLITFPILISFVLIAYLTFSISEIVLPNLMDSILSFFLILIALLVFSSICFFIYIIDKYQGNLMLFVAASCCLFVNALLLINYFYYYNRIFTILINIAEIAGLYFFLQFLLTAKPMQKEFEKEDYF